MTGLHLRRRHGSMSSCDDALGMTLPGGGMPAAPEAVIDVSAIERLRQLDPDGRQGVLGRVLQAYRQSLGRHLDELVAAAAAGDLRTLARISHTLKSSSAAVGAIRFSRCCADLEDLCREQPGSVPGAQVDALIHEGRLVLVAVEAMLSA